MPATRPRCRRSTSRRPPPLEAHSSRPGSDAVARRNPADATRAPKGWSRSARRNQFDPPPNTVPRCRVGPPPSGLAAARSSRAARSTQPRGARPWVWSRTCPTIEHERRRPRPQRALPGAVLRRHRHQRRRGPHRPPDVRLRGQQLRRAHRHGDHPRVELRHLGHPPELQRADQRPGLPRGRAGVPGLALAGHVATSSTSSASAIPYLFDLPLGLGVSMATRRAAIIPDFSGAKGRRPGLARLSVRPPDLCRRRRPGRGRGYPRLQVSRARRLPRRRRSHHPGHDPPGDPVRQPQQPVLADLRALMSKPPSSRAGEPSPSPSSPSKASSTSRPAAGPTARASGP